MRTDGYKLNMSGHFWILINSSDYLMLGPLFLSSWCFWVTLRVCFDPLQKVTDQLFLVFCWLWSVLTVSEMQGTVLQAGISQSAKMQEETFAARHFSTHHLPPKLMWQH